MSAKGQPGAAGATIPGQDPWLTETGREINEVFLADETQRVRELVGLARPPAAEAAAAHSLTLELVESVRANRSGKSGLDAFLRQYDLASKEGVILMCLAEALLRVPDSETADKLIADKIRAGDWARHAGEADSLFVNASTWGLMLTGRIVRPDPEDTRDPGTFIARLASRLGEPVVRGALRQAMRIMGHQFVMGRNIEEALERAHASPQYRYSFDMLGEAAFTSADAIRYFDAYVAAIEALGKSLSGQVFGPATPSISVKLSALHPRYEYAQRRRVHAELTPQVQTLAERARAAGIALTVDAEESERLEISLEIVAAVLRSPVTANWAGFGLAVQAYQKRALPALRHLENVARGSRRTLNVRLVKGAYWDSEVKRAQERGLAGYPVFTRKINTDVSYLACARYMLESATSLYPQFATHNAHTVATIITRARAVGRSFEFQRLHGMGEELYAEVVGPEKLNAPCRVYAPVGAHEDLLPYLVRRLLENGANTSFVNRIVDERLPAGEVAADPVGQVMHLAEIPHPRIPAPRNLFGSARLNSRGVNFADGYELEALTSAMNESQERERWAAPIVKGERRRGIASPVTNPANLRDVVGTVEQADASLAQTAVDIARAAQPDWDAIGPAERARILLRAADAFEEERAGLVSLAVREAGKTLPDGVAEVREAVDFLRYYATQAVEQFGEALLLPGPTGESNRLAARGRGTFACISPWNFPLAIFTGQVAAALVTGNAVIAKPAEQTPLMAARAVELLHAAGVPGEVLAYLPGDGVEIGGTLVGHEGVSGIAFTGSTDTAHVIHRGLAARNGAIATLIAETGGLNAMLVDSSALPEQVVSDVVISAFNSAGQRCSALRVLFLQREIADRVERLLAGYMDELIVGDPADLATDVGPVIDSEAQQRLEAHAAAIVRGAPWQHRVKLGPSAAAGHFVAPLAVEIDSFDRLAGEVFGPILHVVRYEASALDRVLDAINAKGFGLTLGVHTRIDAAARYIANRVRVGNVYVNRNMIGAVVGVQPFGGCGLSGTGPKAGGPRYLERFTTEQTVTINTAAVGGNTTLLSLGD
ncbi:MAG TPA: bifunctional proline dehydrogenase/L-glutamate gamma-semialdehyde dehydrogenase PutA [Steroidobacteraceae bacterium]|nr:bifunctional proline dehydrogenase/L-glutamate gamma-semialdehyde dehydrogenase PutA [Steroidobacteraceae bacterium]